ncbi:hypothetical protein JHJ32_14580 [Parapedobacter sp. ISTM3]|uniref:Addiction module component n=1 Tax=Parapedobacter luteus TaxID=623280 RepID=A0A1T5EBG1_9SPHI|nr:MULTISPECIES: hypothetical protein [Parapedobacter]MBK1441222.1 hypothetical protein [Parapedobacter sp. ISTM3]SKB81201.1 hypothetical protein SAMN05660226_03225 [Parapedobacter luteus]
MSTLELKDMLIHRIAEIDDVQFLEAIKTILDAKTETQAINLIQAQVQEIQASREDIAGGRFVDQDDLDTEYDAWRKRR